MVTRADIDLSVLFNEPKLLKSALRAAKQDAYCTFSALQRAEIAEIAGNGAIGDAHRTFSALQRAEIAEIVGDADERAVGGDFQCSSTSRNC